MQKAVKLAPYGIVQAPNGDAWVEVNGKKMAAPEVSARVLMKLKKDAEAFLGEEIKEAVIAANADPSVYGMILTGAGEKAFAAGADISEFAQIFYKLKRKIREMENK